MGLVWGRWGIIGHRMRSDTRNYPEIGDAGRKGSSKSGTPRAGTSSLSFSGVSRDESMIWPIMELLEINFCTEDVCGLWHVSWCLAFFCTVNINLMTWRYWNILYISCHERFTIWSLLGIAVEICDRVLSDDSFYRTITPCWYLEATCSTTETNYAL